MRISKGFLGGIVAAALIAMTGSAFADHGKAGLWKITTNTQMSGPKSAQQTLSSEHCMTAAEVKNDKIASQNSACKMTNEKSGGGTFSADMICSGQVIGKGSLTLSATSPDAGSASEELEVDYKSDPLEIGFNSRYLLDITRQIGGNSAVFMLADAASPTLARDTSDPSAVYVLMPMRV